MNEPIFTTKKIKEDTSYAMFEIAPLEKGYGDTLGTALRRVLLGGLPGAAIVEAKISGVKHQFSTLKGMKEDVLEFLLNLKKVRLSYEGDKEVKLTLSAKGGVVKASDIKVPTEVEIANGDLILATLAKDTKLDVTMQVAAGVGYSPAEDRDRDKVGVIPLDASFSPIIRVKYKIEETRVGRLTNYDKLTLEVWTDGTTTAEKALKSSAQVLISYFNQIVTPKRIEKEEEEKVEDGLGPIGHLSVEEIGLPTRVANALIKSGYETVKQLSQATNDDLSKVRNLGEKSITIIKKALLEKGVEV